MADLKDLIASTFAEEVTPDNALDFVLLLDTSENALNKTKPSSILQQPDLVTALTAETSIASGDYVIIYDVSVSALRKMTKANFVAGIGGGITNGAGNNVIPKSDGTNLVASRLSDDGSYFIFDQNASNQTWLKLNTVANRGGIFQYAFGGMVIGSESGSIGFGDYDFSPVWGTWQPDGLHVDMGHILMFEETAPSAPAANGCILFVKDNGSGKTQLMALFNTGAAQQVAIQP